MKRIKKFYRKWFPKSLHSPFHSGPRNPKVKVARNSADCQFVILNNGEQGSLIGPWYINGQWDGSYIIWLKSKRIAYLYPSKFAWTGLTVGEAKELEKIKEKIHGKK